MRPIFSVGRRCTEPANPGAAIDLIDRSDIDSVGIVGPGRCFHRGASGEGDASALGSYCYSKMSGISRRIISAGLIFVQNVVLKNADRVDLRAGRALMENNGPIDRDREERERGTCGWTR